MGQNSKRWPGNSGRSEAKSKK